MKADHNTFATLFTAQKLTELFPVERADQFFEALLGDADEGAYDIHLAFKGYQDDQLLFDLELRQRPGKCLVCNLTYGLPTVFSRHPVINIQGLVDRINGLMDGSVSCKAWKLGQTREISRQLHIVPLVIQVETEK